MYHARSKVPERLVRGVAGGCRWINYILHIRAAGLTEGYECPYSISCVVFYHLLQISTQSPD